MLTNTVRMILCIVIGILCIVSSGSMSYIMPNMKILAISGLSGIATAVMVVTWLVAVRKGHIW